MVWGREASESQRNDVQSRDPVCSSRVVPSTLVPWLLSIVNKQRPGNRRGHRFRDSMAIRCSALATACRAGVWTFSTRTDLDPSTGASHRHTIRECQLHSDGISTRCKTKYRAQLLQPPSLKSSRAALALSALTMTTDSRLPEHPSFVCVHSLTLDNTDGLRYLTLAIVLLFAGEYPTQGALCIEQRQRIDIP
ncbi:hypothetical protein PENSPDRAFT_48540 [Peniophora sp. CONT]|nr:hypothetical protein PENSPDRAFT_48540 [Peniophora sp. CONT]